MIETPATNPASDTPQPPGRSRARRMFSTLSAGLRGVLFFPLHLHATDASWGMLMFLLAARLGIQFASDVLYVGRHGEFVADSLPGALFYVPVILLAAWGAARAAGRNDLILTLLTAFSAISLPFTVGDNVLQWAIDTDRIHETAILITEVLMAWFALACAVAAIRLGGQGVRRKLAVLFATTLLLIGPSALIPRAATLWAEPLDQGADLKRAQRDAMVNEDVFYAQPDLLEHELQAVQANHKGGINLYFVGAAGFAEQDVFMKEVDFVSKIFKQRFGTEGHSISLINNPASATRAPVATVTSLERALNRVGDVMDTSKDILFLYLTSHGSKEHKFALEFGSMRFFELDPKTLRELLDASGIRRRVIVISACYAGGFIDALKNDDTLVIAAAAADRTSFGCSNEADFTYFGKAYFEEALGKTSSFIDAFGLATKSIAARERSDEVEPSNPRMAVGANIAAALASFERQRSALHPKN